MTHRLTFLAATLLALGIPLAACGGGGDGVTPAASGTTDATSQATGKNARQPRSTLSAAEVESLSYMREEEELAHDVYVASGRLWPAAVFDNIAASEVAHTEAVQTLLDRYALPNPLTGLPDGTFRTAELQVIHDQLVATSRLSLIDALTVGVQIEEMDIRDISAQMSEVDNADILNTYDNLLRGSRNHLRAFMKVLTRQGGSYVPQYISQEAFDAIVNSPTEKGR